MFKLCCSDTKPVQTAKSLRIQNTVQLLDAMGVRARASTRSSLRVRVSVVNQAVAHKLNFRHHGAEMMGMPRPMLENTRVRTDGHPPSLKSTKATAIEGRQIPPPPTLLPPQRTTARPAPQGRMMQLQTRRRTRTRF